MTYNSAQKVGINLDSFALDGGKTYVFAFGSGAGGAKIASDGSTYSNVRIVVQQRNGTYDLILDSVFLKNGNTVLTSDASTLNLGCYGNTVGICATKAAKGKNGEYCSSFWISSINAGDGYNGNVAVVCSGKINITVSAKSTTIKGGEGGNGGDGGDCDGSGSTGGHGGDGGSGAWAIKADTINVSFKNGATKSNLNISGGAGGSGGEGGYGTIIGILGIGFKGNYGDNGSGGASATPSNVPINYL